VSTAKTNAASSTVAWTLKSLALWYACISIFAYSFLVREALLHHLDKTVVDNLGIAIVGGATVLGMIWAGRNHRTLWGNRPAMVCFAASIAAALIGLGSVDPAFPAKRIHVVEYFLLAGLVFTAFKSAGHLAVRGLVALTVTAMLGGLDELLQGAIVQRTYGLADMLTNTLGALAGVMAVCGVRFYKGWNREDGRLRLAGAGAPIALAVGYFMALAVLYPFRGLPFPLWGVLPVAGGLVLIAHNASAKALSIGMERFSVVVGTIAVTAVGGMIYVQVMAIRFL